MGRRARKDDDFDDTLEQSHVAKRSKVDHDDEDATSSKDEGEEHGSSRVDLSDTPKVDMDTKINKLRLKKQERKERKKAKAQERAHQDKVRIQERAEISKPEASPQYDVVTCRKGVQYQDILLGKGPVLQDRQKCHVKYTLRKANAKGKIIDASNDFGFRVGKGEVIEGWDIGMGGMRQGGKRHLFIPPEAGYGNRDIGAGKGGLLFFEVSLLSC